MGMYCCCGQKIRADNEWECLCDWDGWISVYDWPPERKNKKTSLTLPDEEGVYLTRHQDNSGDRYECVKKFNPVPRMEWGGYFEKRQYPIHWEGECWEEGGPYAWKEISNDETPVSGI